MDKNQPEILIVEDSRTQAVELQFLLEQNGYTVFVAHDGSQALKLLESHSPSIVISDIIMPEMDGYELCRRIKGTDSTKHVFLILLTSLSETRDVIKSLQCGADKFFTKPYDERLLLSAIRELTNNAGLSGEEREQKPLKVSYNEEEFVIDSGRRQIINLLISTYEAAVKKNKELLKAQKELKAFNRNLESKIEERTADLQAKNEELNTISQQLWHAAKLATMGELLASIAHELNNPLAIIGLRIESLLEKPETGDGSHRELEIISNEVERMGGLISNLLQFGRRSVHQVSTVDPREEADKTLELIRYRMRKQNISIETVFQPDVSLIHADRQKLRQLFLDLFTNASDAMPGGGTITINVYNRQKEQRDGKAGQPAVVVEILDTGLGIPEDFAAKLAEPFFTTKPEGKGTGLGLAICKRIVQEHGGMFEIMNRDDGQTGAMVRIALPISRSRAEVSKNIDDMS